MKFASTALLVLTLLFSFSSSAMDCDAAVSSLEKSLLAKTSAKCKEDADCDGFYFRADPCASAIVLAKSAVSDEFKEMITKKQEAAKKACAKEYEAKTMCTPVPFRAVCIRNKCFDRKVDKPNPPTGNL